MINKLVNRIRNKWDLEPSPSLVRFLIGLVFGILLGLVSEAELHLVFALSVFLYSCYQEVSFPFGVEKPRSVLWNIVLLNLGYHFAYWLLVIVR